MPMSNQAKYELSHYPPPAEVDSFCARIIESAATVKYTATKIPDPGNKIEVTIAGSQHAAHYVKFQLEDGSQFYCYWQPAAGKGPSPTLINTPGYSGVVSTFPYLVARGFNMLHINPLNYSTPEGVDLDSRMEISPEAVRLYEQTDASKTALMATLYPKPVKVPPVAFQTIAKEPAGGYEQWLVQALVAVRWAKEQQQQVDTGGMCSFGASQGGWGSIMLGSLLGPCGTNDLRAVVANEPFLTHIPIMLDYSQPEHPVVAELQSRYAILHPDTVLYCAPTMAAHPPITKQQTYKRVSIPPPSKTHERSRHHYIWVLFVRSQAAWGRY